MTRRNGEWGWSDLEELIQCPVCLDKPDAGTNVEQCKNGHHICSSCKLQINMCPICKGHFYGTRNFVVEELINHYEVLKNIMLLNNLIQENRVKKKKKRAANRSAIQVVVERDRKVNTPHLTKGDYPCRVRNCDVKLPSSRLLNHARSCHLKDLSQVEVGEDGVFSSEVEIGYHTANPITFYSYIYSVRGIGLMYINMEILRSGEMIIFCQMAAKSRQATKYMIDLHFGPKRGERAFALKQLFVSLRDTPEGMMQRRYCYVINKNQARPIWSNRKSHCLISISPFRPNTPPPALCTKECVNMFRALRNSLIDEITAAELARKIESVMSACRSNASSTVTTSSGINGINLQNIGRNLGNSLKSVPATSTASGNNVATNSKKAQKKKGKKKKNGSSS